MVQAITEFGIEGILLKQAARQKQKAVIQPAAWVLRREKVISHLNRRAPVEPMIRAKNGRMVPRIEIPIHREDLEFRLIIQRESCLVCALAPRECRGSQ